MTPWETPLREYVGVAPVIGSAPHLVDRGPAALKHATRGIETWSRIEVAERPDLVFHVDSKRKAAVTDANTGEVLGGLTAIFPFVPLEYRGRNICAELNAVLDNLGHRRMASAYTNAGLGARVATHRLHVERALASGKPVPQAVLQDYLKDASGRLRLHQPYTAKQHNAWAGAKAAEEAARCRTARRREMTEGYLEVFKGAEDDRSRAFQDYEPGWKGYLLAIALHRQSGCHFRVSIQDRLCIVQAEIGDEVIDCDGIRPRGIARKDLQRRDLLSEEGELIEDPFFGNRNTGRIKTLVFKDEASFLAALGPGVEGMPGANLPVFDIRALEEAEASLPGRLMMGAAARRYSFEPAPCPAL